MAAPPDETNPQDREVERLRRLVGIDEKSYQDLLIDVEQAYAAARQAHAELGRIRALNNDLSVDLQRARSALDALQRHTGIDAITLDSGTLDTGQSKP